MVTRKSQSFSSTIVGVCVFGFLVRAGYVLWLRQSIGLQQFSDFDYLFRLGCSLASGDGFTLDGVRIWNQSLGYPLFLAPFLKLFGPHVAVALTLNILLGTATVALTTILAHLIFSTSPQPALHSLGGVGALPPQPARHNANLWAGSTLYIPLLAGILAAAYPDLLLYTGLCAAENLLLPLTLAMACCGVYAWKRSWVGGGVCGGLAALAATSKALVFFLVPILPIYWMVTRRKWFLMSLCAAVAGVAVLAPWTIRNYQQCGHIVPFAAVSGETFLDGNNPKARGVPSGTTSLPEIEASGLHAVEKDRLKMQHAISFMRENPSAYAKLLVMKTIRMLVPVRDFVFEANHERRFFGVLGSRYVPTLFNAVLYLGIAFSLAFPRLSTLHPPPSIVHTPPSTLYSPAWWFTVLVTGMMVVIQLIFFAYSRYRLPFLCVLLPSVAQGWLFIVRSTVRKV